MRLHSITVDTHEAEVTNWLTTQVDPEYNTQLGKDDWVIRRIDIIPADNEERRVTFELLKVVTE